MPRRACALPLRPRSALRLRPPPRRAHATGHRSFWSGPEDRCATGRSRPARSRSRRSLESLSWLVSTPLGEYRERVSGTALKITPEAIIGSHRLEVSPWTRAPDRGRTVLSPGVDAESRVGLGTALAG